MASVNQAFAIVAARNHKELAKFDLNARPE
jgi:hypothetical protein